jgi:[methyl-Co(III) methanol-specific corrinoid protein]:coenzyme M methyltransferase
MKLNSYERIMAVLSGKKEEVDRLPAFNSQGTYTLEGMKAFDAYWPAAHKDPVKMAKLGSALHRLAGLESVVVPFELTLEAEVLGAEIEFFEDRIKWPSIKKFIAKDVSDLKLPSNPEDAREVGRVPVVCEAIKLLKREFEGKVPVIACVCCPFESISSYLVDSVEFFKMCITEPKKIQEFMKVATPYYAEIAKAFKEAGADIITFREESVSLNNIHPKHFDQLVKPYLKELVAYVKPPRILHACGKLWNPRLETISGLVECGTEAITIEEKTPMDKAREIADNVKKGYPIGGNIGAYSVIHQGPIDKIRERVKKVIEEGSDMPMPGCDFWLETPTEHVKAFVDAVIQYGSRRH